jgi:hypothetical protein
MVKKRSSQLVRLELLKAGVGIEDKPQEEAQSGFSLSTSFLMM